VLGQCHLPFGTRFTCINHIIYHIPFGSKICFSNRTPTTTTTTITRCAIAPIAAFTQTVAPAKAFAATHYAEHYKQTTSNAIGPNAKDTTKSMRPSSSAGNAGRQNGQQIGASPTPRPMHTRRHHQHQLAKVATTNHQVWTTAH
jgi:hypothetical protein